MPKKLTIEHIRQKFENEGYQLLTTVYKASSQKLEYVCPKGHFGTVRWGDWTGGHRCAECAGNKKKDINFIRKELEKEGYQLLTTNYINNTQKLEYVCSKGHRSSIIWNSWKNGRRCKQCAKEKKLLRERRKSWNNIQKGFKSDGYTLLTEYEEYINNKQLLRFICNKGHHSSISWNNWYFGHRCRICQYINLSGDSSPNWKNYTREEIKQFEKYRANVKQLTNQNYKKYYYYINFNKLYRSNKQYHIDHIFTVIDGFNNKILPEIIASPINLQMLPAKENISKHGRSDMSKEILYELYYQFEEEIKETKI